MKNPSRFLMAAPALLALLQVGCVNVELEGLATAECLQPSDCQAGATCIAGSCVACGAEVCDGADNDCDGSADEGFDLASDANHCGACGNACEADCRNGACAPVECSPTEEVCNGGDDDCDGTVDEGTLNACGACGAPPAETCNGTDDDCDGATDEGTLNACGACGAAPVEACNGADDDCDGATDEGVLNACGRCGAPPPETCNGVDDDCDGTTDEGFADLEAPCTVGVGVCAATGTWGCAPGGDEVVCSARAQPVDGPERCGDGLDNDCDGATDEGFTTGEDCAVGVGACRAQGTTACDAEGLAVVCNAVEGLGVDEACNGLDDDCDGGVDEGFDLQNDAGNCGACGQVCTLPNAAATCTEGACAVLACEADFDDVDALPDNGCECAVGIYDAPDPEGIDSNCDGIDGTVARSVFVSALHGLDGAAGTPEAPVRTLAAALQRLGAGRTDVLLTAEDHELPGVTILRGRVRLAGGYSYTPGLPPAQQWARATGAPAVRTRLLRIDGGSPALAVDVNAEVHLAGLEIGFAEGPLTVASPVALFARACTRLDLDQVTLQAPRGVAGPRGRTGVDAPDRAGAGEAGRPSAGLPVDPSAPGGTNVTCLEGTAGGVGGATRLGGGLAGGASEGGAAGGLGFDNLGEDPAQPGEDGREGAAGEAAAPSEQSGRVDPLRLAWNGPRGSEAANGTTGVGGGGGGASIGFGGGGGGAAGCPGTAGGSGTAGGASIGLVVAASCAVSVREALIVTAGGAEGGDAGAGGLGGPGGPGGASEGGGRGGQGGPGGCGGHGAPGPGGPTFGVLLFGPVAASPALDARFELGLPGSAGAPVPANHPCGGGPQALDGQQLEVACCADLQACGTDLRCVAP